MATPETYLTLGQAAKAANKSKGTISKAITSGKMSFVEKAGNSYKIDPAELFRVFPVLTTGVETTENVSSEQLETPTETQVNRELELELKHARELLRREETAHAETKEEKRRLLDTLENQTRLLVHLKEEIANKPPEMPVQRRKGFWAALFDKRH